MMTVRSTAVLLMLGARGALSQSAEPSQWDTPGDDGLSDVSPAKYGCPADKVFTSSSDFSVTVAQTAITGATATMAFSGSNPAIAFLEDAYGTILAFTASVSGNSVDFTWEPDASPGGLRATALFVRGDTCYMMTSDIEATWSSIIDDYMSSDPVFGDTGAVGNSSYGSPPTFESVTIEKAKVTFQVESNHTDETISYAWVKNSKGEVIYFRNTTDLTAPFETPDITLDETSTELVALETLCSGGVCVVHSTSTDLVGLHIDNYLAQGTTAATNDVKSDILCVGTACSSSFSPNTYRIVATCPTSTEDYTLFALNDDDNASSMLAYASSRSIEFSSMDASLNNVVYSYLVCLDGTVYKSTHELDSSSVGFAPSSIRQVPVEDYDCEGEHGDGSVFELDGKSCTCSKGATFCDAADPDTKFRLSDGEAVGLALSVSVIALILLMGVIFMCLKNSAQKQELIEVMASNAKSEVAQDDRL